MGVRRKKGSGKPIPRERRVITLENLDIELRPFKDLGFKPANVVVGISSEGIVGPLVAAHLIQQLEMDQVCALESPMFPPTSMVYFEKPKFPARIYASRKHRLAVVLAEFAPTDELARPLAYAILAWCETNGARRVFAIESFPPELASPAGVPVAAIGATPRDRTAITKAKVAGVRHGAVTGVAGVLVNEGRWWDRDTVVFMASLGEAGDIDAALQVLAAMHRIEPNIPAPEAMGGDRTQLQTQLQKAIKAAHERPPTHDYI